MSVSLGRAPKAEGIVIVKALRKKEACLVDSRHSKKASLDRVQWTRKEVEKMRSVCVCVCVCAHIHFCKDDQVGPCAPRGGLQFGLYSEGEQLRKRCGHRRDPGNLPSETDVLAMFLQQLTESWLLEGQWGQEGAEAGRPVRRLLPQCSWKTMVFGRKQYLWFSTGWIYFE